MIKLKENKGITLIALIVLIIILLILSAVVIKNMNNGSDFRNYNEMCADIQLIHDKILIYYNQYGKLPITGEIITSLPTEIPTGTYYEVDISKLNNITLNYGNKSLGTNDIYIVNKDTFNVYYLGGIQYKGEIHYAESHNSQNVGTEPVTTTTTYIDSEGTVATVPAGFVVSNATGEKNISTGLVIYEGTEEVNDSNVATARTTRNQYVWVPVANIETMATYQTTYTYPTVINGHNYSSGYYQGKLYNFSGTGAETTSTEKTSYGLGTSGTGSWKEPSLVTINSADTYIKTSYTGTDYDASTSDKYYETAGYTSTILMGEGMLDEYQEMIASIDEYKGFYVGRYETSMNGNVMQSKVGRTPMKSINWYQMYYNQNSRLNSNNPYYGSTSVISGMISGSQWDAMLNWILTGTDKAYVTSTSNVSHNLSSTYYTGGTNYTGTVTYNDKENNIYDLEGNVWEWTTEADSTTYRASRGRLLP